MTARTSDFYAILRKETGRSRLDELCEFAPVDGTRAEIVLWFTRLVGWLRPLPGQRAGAKVRFLAARLDAHAEWAERVAGTFGALLRDTDLRRLFSHGGIPGHFHLGGAVKDWVVERLLPTACDTPDGATVLRLAFRPEDLVWLRDPEVAAFARALALKTDVTIGEQVRAAMFDLAHEIVATAHAPSVRQLARAERSPFRGLYDAVAEAVSSDDSALRGRIKQCLLFLRGHREELASRGADLNTTFQLRRLDDELARLDLLALLHGNPSSAAIGLGATSLVHASLGSFAGKRLFSRSADLVVQNLVDSAATVGRKYLDDEESSWGAAFKAGAGGGLLMVLATVIKLSLAKLHLSPFYEGIVFSLNYASVFCAAYLMHYTIATKLPAHTAATLARCVQEGSGYRARVNAFVAIWRNTVRLQLAGLLGNIAVAGPLAYALGWAILRFSHHPIIGAEKAAHILHDQSVIGPSVLYAALTGCFLWLSSLLAAGADNWTRTQRVADRIATNIRVLEHIGEPRARGWAEAVTKRIGPLTGNAALGFMLGLVPAAFAIASLPVEIRHVTVSTSSVAIAIASAPSPGSAIALAVTGVALIGIVNCTVSFILALWLALRATRGLRSSSTANALVRIGIRRWMR